MKIISNQQNIILDKSLKMLEGHIIPKASHSYDYQKFADNRGITRELYRFKDALGKIIKEVENVINGNLLKEVRVTAFESRRDADIKRVFVKDAKTGNISYTKEETFPMEHGTMSYIEIVERGKVDEHKIRFVSDGVQDKEISYKTNWDGNKPKLHYKNIKGTLPEEGLEYLPLVVSEGSTKRINHIVQAQINAHSHIKNLALLPNLKSCEDLNNGKSREEIRLYWLSQCLGKSGFNQVFLFDKIKPNEKLLEIISHEYQHVADKIGINKILSKFNLYLLKTKLLAAFGLDSFKYTPFRLKRVAVERYKSLKDGVLLPFSKKYKEYSTLNKDIVEYKAKIRRNKSDRKDYKIYRENPLEARAFDKANEEHRKFYSLLLSIKDLMTTL